MLFNGYCQWPVGFFAAIRVAFQDEIITDAENWMEALKKRNLTSHTYNENVLNETMVFLTTQRISLFISAPLSYRDNLV
jgi:hypothetical protein